MRTIKTASIMVLLGTAACQSSDTSPAPEPAPTPGGPLHAEPPIDLGGSVPAAALAFAHDGAVLRAGHLTHEVKLTDDFIDVTPSHRDPETGQRLVGGALGLRTTAVAVGGEGLSLVAGAPRPVGAGNVVEIPRGELTELVTNREDGIEQAWRFEQAPQGGDLSVEVEVAGHRFVESTASGLHFRSDRGLGFRYSHAIWRDAAGAAWDIAARYEDGRIVMTVPEEVLVASAYPAVLDPTVSAELFVDVPASGTTGRASLGVDMAGGGTQYFLVWQDQRHGNRTEIYGTRLGADGAVLDPDGILVGTAAGGLQNPAVALIGTEYIVAWEHVVAAGNSDIAAALVSADGAVTQLGTIAGTSANETLPAVGGRAGEALVVWQSGGDLIGARYALGAFGAPAPIAAGANIEKEPAVSGNPGGDYLVTFTETVDTNDNVRGQLVSPLGLPNGAAFDLAAGATAEGASSAAFDGTNHVVAWTVINPGTANDIAARRVGPTGTLLEAAPVDINRGVSGQIAPDVACHAAGCFIAWEDLRQYGTTLRDVFGAVVAPDLTVTANDLPVMPFARQQTAPAVATVGGAYLAGWNDTRDPDVTTVRATRVDAAGAVVDAGAAALVVVRSTSNYGAPAIGQTSGLTDLFFSESQVPDTNLMHVRFYGTGVQRDPTPLVVSAAPFGQLSPAATGMGALSFVAWQDARTGERDIRAARLDTVTGAVLDPDGIPVAVGTGDQLGPKVASAGTSALIVWQDRRTGSFDIMGALVTSAGVLALTDIPICTAAGDQTRPNVAYDATNGVYLVVWNDPSGGTLDIRGARVSAAGVVLDADCGTVISGGSGAQFSPDVAAGGGQFLVVWEDRRNDPSRGDIFGARVRAMGGITVLDPAGLSIAVHPGTQQAEPAVAFGSGGSFAVVWTDDRNAATTSTDILGAQVSPTGIVSVAFPVANAPESERAADISPGTTAAKPFSVAYLKANPALDSTRIQLRRLTIVSSLGKACTADSQCESGFCRDNKCCDSDCGGGGAYGNLGDCQACSIAHYGQADGTCTLIIDTTYRCRPYVNSLCDVPERCDGISTECGPDLGQFQGRVCNTTTGAVCPANDVSGAPHYCPDI
ncbi:MAG TPA: hypothetical protein VK932_04880 [Kofleriaceae bacterium]|nr:hypothetical protein [Kofleriaceae bacterium]